jgi:hypothetical protein
MTEPAQDGPRRFIHNVICPDHVLVDRQTGRLSGLVDCAGFARLERPDR